MNYRVNLDRVFTTISATKDQADNEEIFKSFSAAKKVAQEYLNDEIRNLKSAQSDLKKLKKNNVEVESD